MCLSPWVSSMDNQTQIHKTHKRTLINREVLLICKGWKFLTLEGQKKYLPKLKDCLTLEIDHPWRLKLLWRYKLSSKTPTLRTSRASLPQIKRRRSTNVKNITCSAFSNQAYAFNQLQEHHMFCFLQIKCRRSTKRESNDQILEIEQHRIESTKIQHQLKFNSTNQIFSDISCEHSSHLQMSPMMNL